MRQVAEPLYSTDAGITAGFDNLYAAAGAFDKQAEIPSATRRRRGTAK
jgi:hypothetical protein